MKILEVEIKNLASIADAKIDFSQKPLNNAPLFLICGDTGAGKSTITDAICLSLFGKTPRFENSNKEDFDLTEKAEIKTTSDNRHILRHGTSEAYARTIFEADNGLIYKSEWSVKRANKKSNGKLQSDILVLYVKNQKSDFEPITQNKSEVPKKIEELIGFNFNRFIRAVLLAQNQFSKFLLANKDEKSEILQMLTNTDIYEKISIKLYEKNKIAEQNLNVKKQLIESKKLPNIDDIENNKIIINDIEKQLINLEKDNEIIQNKINWTNQFNIFNNQLKIEIYEFNANELEFNKIQSSKIQLEKIKIVLENFKPLINNINSINQDILKNKQNLDNLKENTNHYLFIFNKLNQKIKDLSQQISTCENQLKPFENKNEIFENIQSINSYLDNINSLNIKAIDTNKNIEKFETKIKQLSENKSIAENDLKSKEDKNNELKLVLDKAIENQNKINNDKNQEDLEKTNKEISNLEQALIIVDNLNKQVEIITKLEAQLSEYQTKFKENQNIISQLEIKTKEAEIKFKTAEEIYNNQRDASTKNVENLRKMLVDGKPCPVCGSEIHPYATKTEQVIVNMVENLKLNKENFFDDFNTNKINLEKIKTNNESLNDNIKKLVENDIPNQKNELNKLNERIKKMINYYHFTDNNLEQQILNSKSEKEKIKADIKQKITEYSNLEKATNLARKNYESIKLQFEKSQKNVDEIIKQIELSSQNLNNLKSQLNSILSDKETILTNLKKYYTTDDNIKNISKNPVIFKELLIQDFQNFSSLKKDLENLQNLLSKDENILTKCSKIDELKSLFSDIYEKECNINEQSFDNLPENIVETLTSTKKINDDYSILEKKINEESLKFDNLLIENNKNIEFQLTKNEIDILAKTEDFQRKKLEENIKNVEQKYLESKTKIAQIKSQISEHNLKPEKTSESENIEFLNNKKNQLKSKIEELNNKKSELSNIIKNYEKDKLELDQLIFEKNELQEKFNDWNFLYSKYGSSDGKKLRNIAQSYTLGFLLNKANYNLQRLTNKYELTCNGESLAILVNDLEMNTLRPVTTLSGGESFMVSLALALGLSDMMKNGKGSEMLFIDEGFGTLDNDCLNSVISLLEKLNSQGRKVGIISHVNELQERISAKIIVKKCKGDNTKSEVLVVNE
ncbi:MAG: AAA family ATPase [Bacteroidales bacterium]|nr:AAA family ATPase [Bacteroidales bacterium]